MLEQVSQARTALDLLPRADVIPETDRHDRSQMVLREDEAQAIVQTVLGRPQASVTVLPGGLVTHGVHVPSIACRRSTATVCKEAPRPAAWHPGQLAHRHHVPAQPHYLPTASRLDPGDATR